LNERNHNQSGYYNCCDIIYNNTRIVHNNKLNTYYYLVLLPLNLFLRFWQRGLAKRLYVISHYVTHFSLCHSFLVMSLISRYLYNYHIYTILSQYNMILFSIFTAEDIHRNYNIQDKKRTLCPFLFCIFLFTHYFLTQHNSIVNNIVDKLTLVAVV
jgi:hypothetical protein